jgi:hypothetical protein
MSGEVERLAVVAHSTEDKSRSDASQACARGSIAEFPRELRIAAERKSARGDGGAHAT